MSADDCARRDVPHNYGACGNNRAIADADARSHEGVRADPYVVSDDNWCLDKREVFAAVIVCTAAQVRALRYRTTLPNHHGTQIVQDDFVAHGRPVADSEFPGDGHPYRRVDVDPRADGSPEASQKTPAPCPERSRAEAECWLN